MRHPTDQELDQSVAAMLRVGTGIAALIVLIGGFLLLSDPRNTASDYRHFQAGNPALRSMTGIVQGAIDLAPKSIIQFGILILIATPVGRVVLCMIGFARQRSALYVAISASVLLILLYSMLRK